MKNQYFGDVNDYRKYGLLRCIAEATGLPIGVLWMLTKDDGRSDGEFRRYLADGSVWSRHDAKLHDALSRLLVPGETRRVTHAERWGLVPGATYFDHVFPDAALARAAVFQEACKKLSPCPFVFLDPDNGVEVKSVSYGRKRSSKYVYWSEMATLFERGHSLLVYQHYQRVKRSAFEDSLAEKFRSRLGAKDVAVFSTPHVAFFLALQESHAVHLPGIRATVGARWRGQIEARAGSRPGEA